MTHSELGETPGLYPFTQTDLGPEAMDQGAKAVLDDFFQWRDENPELIAEHVEEHTAQLEAFIAEEGPRSRLGRLTSLSSREAYELRKLTRELEYFGVYNLGEMPTQGVVQAVRSSNLRGRAFKHGKLAPSANTGGEGLVKWLHGRLLLPELLPEMRQFGDHLDRLHHILPEAIVQEGGMGKAVRTAAGVLAIGVFDTIGENPSLRQEHIARIIPSAYGYGALYPIIDDTLQDGGYVAAKDRSRYDELILEGLRSGEPVNASRLPDHPLAEELEKIYGIFLETFPFGKYRHLYQAGESMYLAQNRDAAQTPETVAVRGLTHLYPDIFVKASMSRVIANILGRRSLDDAYYARSIGINFVNQLRDDLQDRAKDRQAGRLTPFTYEGRSDTNPLYDLFAYSAFLAHRNFGGDPAAARALAYSSASKLAAYVFSRPESVQELRAVYDMTPEMLRFMRAAGSMPLKQLAKLSRGDLVLQERVNRIFGQREQTALDPRTFVSDRLSYINSVIRESVRCVGQGRVGEIVSYALEAGGKRLRPALTLMAAEGLGMDRRTLEPLLTAVELFHTSSLVFDDLPAQDNSRLRRGRPTAHVAFDEAGAQLAGVSMVSSGFGLLSKLKHDYPAERVAEVVQYFGSVMGPSHLCLGQDMDLRMGKTSGAIKGEDIIKMYELKTSASIEAAILPVLMLAERPAKEIELAKEFARCAGIVFQIRDDILDATTTSEVLGKEVGADIDKVNLVRVFGLEEAQNRMRQYLEAAVQCCKELPFDTRLMQRMATHFAARTK